MSNYPFQVYMLNFAVGQKSPRIQTGLLKYGSFSPKIGGRKLLSKLSGYFETKKKVQVGGGLRP